MRVEERTIETLVKFDGDIHHHSGGLIRALLVNSKRLGHSSVADNMALSFGSMGSARCDEMPKWSGVLVLIMRSMESYVLRNVFATGGALLNETGRATYILVLVSDVFFGFV
ncbi:hypothetical protein Tco_1201341 [Tanacetum coccineum]